MEGEETPPLASAAASSAAEPGEPAAGAALDHLGRRLLPPLFLALLAYAGLALFADARELRHELAHGLAPALLAPVLALSLANYALRFWRWQLYLRWLAVPLPWTRSLGVFLVGFLLSITPGKAGELGKAWLVRELGGGQARRVVPAVVAERLIDALAALLVVLVGALAFPGGGWLTAGGGALAAAGILALTYRPAAEKLLMLLARLPRLGHHGETLSEIYDLLRSLLAPRRMLIALGLAVAAWSAEGIGFTLVVRAYQPQESWLAGNFVYNLSGLIGGLSMLPGGLLAAEGTLTGFLGAQGLERAAAASATLVTRAATLWFAALLGLAALPVVARWLRRRRYQGTGGG